jgi:zinc transport system substrate-binding protein
MRWVRAVATIALVLGACGPLDRGGTASSKPRVVASFYPVAHAARAIAGDRASVTNLTPPRVEPHELELTSGQVIAATEADLLLYVGRGFQPAVESLAAEMGDRAVDLLAGQELAAAPEPGEGPVDPHVWLDPRRMAAIGRVIADRLASIDPANAAAYQSNGAALRALLRDLDRAFSRGLDDCRSRKIVTSHEAFGYLARRYGLTQVGIAGLDPEAEPSPQRIAFVTEFTRRHNVTTIFFETLVSPRVAQTIAAEVGARTAVLDPLEGPPPGGDYFTGMRSNLAALRRALGCG